MQRRWTLALVAAAALTGSALAGLLAVGDVVPDAALTMADGKTRKLSSWEDRTVVLFFYGTWSKRAAADLEAVAALRKGRTSQPLTLVGIARDAKPDEVRKFAADQKLDFPQAADPKGELYGRFAEKGLPWLAVLDAKRKLRWSAAGVQAEDVDAVLTEILGAPEKPQDGGAK